MLSGLGFFCSALTGPSCRSLDEGGSALNFLQTWTVYFQAVLQISRNALSSNAATSSRLARARKEIACSGNEMIISAARKVSADNQRRAQLFGHTFEPRGRVHTESPTADKI